MAGAIMEKVWGLFGMDPAEDRDEEEETEGYEDEEEVEGEDEEQEERKIWGVVSEQQLCTNCFL